MGTTKKSFWNTEIYIENFPKYLQRAATGWKNRIKIY